MKEFSPIITIHGNKELYIENFKKIYELRNELVKICLLYTSDAADE